MINYSVSDLREAVELHGTQAKAAEALGISQGTISLKLANNSEPEEPTFIEYPPLPDDDMDVEQYIKMCEDRFKKDHALQQAKRWMPYKVNSNEPIGIMWFGDPHLDDNGCNWPLLRRHIDICKNTPGIYGANIGDTTNNWVGRLMRLFAEQDASQKTARRLAKWFLTECGVNWLIWIMGNHDAWNDGDSILKLMNVNHVPMEDWGAKFKLVFPNGLEIKINAAHDHKGHSQYNPLHAQQKAYLWGDVAHLFIAGHKHNWALMQQEDPERGYTHWFARARGYKFIDHFAQVHGFPEQQEGAAILVVIDPEASTKSGQMICFSDVEKGAEFLTYLRSKK